MAMTEGAKRRGRSSKAKITELLGVSSSTATSRLRKSIIFALLRQTNKDVCYQCCETIESIEELSIEHVKPWLNDINGKELFFDLNNIAFSHLICNIKAGGKPSKIYITEDQRQEQYQKRLEKQRISGKEYYKKNKAKIDEKNMAKYWERKKASA